MKLTSKQNEVIWCLQNGYVLVTDSSVCGAWVASSAYQFHINNGVFWRLVEKGLIIQGDERVRQGFVLTKLGETFKTTAPK